MHIIEPHDLFYFYKIKNKFAFSLSDPPPPSVGVVFNIPKIEDNNCRAKAFISFSKLKKKYFPQNIDSFESPIVKLL